MYVAKSTGLLVGALREERGDFLRSRQADDQSAAKHRVDLAVREALADEETRGSHEDPVVTVFDGEDRRLQVRVVPLVRLLLQRDLGVSLAGHRDARLDLRPGGVNGFAMNLELHVLQLGDGNELVRAVRKTVALKHLLDAFDRQLGYLGAPLGGVFVGLHRGGGGGGGGHSLGLGLAIIAEGEALPFRHWCPPSSTGRGT